VTTEVLPDAGLVKVNNSNSGITNLKVFYENVGLCPQHDPFWDEITLREHLMFYASIKKIPEHEITKKCNEYFDLFIVIFIAL
jgi:ABC-type multidrug transport system ATPase subunit